MPGRGEDRPLVTKEPTSYGPYWRAEWVLCKKILTQHDVTQDLVVVHLDVTDCNTKAQDLLELELDGGTDLRDLVAEILGMGDGSGELAGCGSI